MQSRFIEIENSTRIPFTGNRFTIIKEGIVTDNLLGRFAEITKTALNEPIVLLNNGYETFEMKIAVVLAIITKRIRLPYNHCKKIDVMYIDNNPENFQPSNTVWKFPEGGLKVNDSTDFCYIPGFSRYSINLNGEIYSHVTRQSLSPYQDKMGYFMFGLTPDVGKRTIMGMHRAIALAHKQYPSNVDSLDVNHLDGIKSSNSIGNLEWASRKRNCDHAYSTGLRTDNVEVETRNAFTGEINSYYSFQDCGRKLGVSGGAVRLRIQSSGNKVYPPGLQFKAKTDSTKWIEYLNPLSEMRKVGFNIPVKVTDVNTGQQFIFNRLQELCDLLNISSPTLFIKFQDMKDFVIIQNYKIEYITLGNCI